MPLGKLPVMTSPIRLEPGDTAPEFTLPDADGRPVSLSGYRGRRVIVYFYPAASTPGCTKQACDFTAAREELSGGGVDVIGISPDPPAKLARFRDAQNLSIALLSDVDRAVMSAYGTYGSKKLYGKTVTGVIRSTFVLDADGRVDLAQYNVKASGHVDKLRRELAI